MMQFGVAYIVMLLAMYYNGYFLICIFLGAFVGSFIFNWETLGLESLVRKSRLTVPTNFKSETQQDPTVCCG